MILKCLRGTSLTVQWLMLHFPMQRVQVQSLFGEIPLVGWIPPCVTAEKTKHKKQRNNIVCGVCNFLGSVLSQQKFEVMDQLSDGPVLLLHVTAQFYLENKGKYNLEA